MKNKGKKSEMTFYSARGIMLLIIAVLIFATLAIIGMHSLGVINVPSFISNIFNTPTQLPPAPPAANIAAQSGEAVFNEALPRDEYAAALADIAFPKEFYYNYTITRFSGEFSRAVNYVAIGQNDNWWIQTKEDDVIMSTALCKDGVLQFSDNADNTSATTSATDISFAEYSGFTPLKDITFLIRSITSGENVEYGGGINDYSLSYTQARGTSENLFNFSFSRKDGISEEYTFALESATVLSIKKFNSDGEKIYQMEMKDSRNSLEEIDADSLITLKNND